MFILFGIMITMFTGSAAAECIRYGAYDRVGCHAFDAQYGGDKETCKDNKFSYTYIGDEIQYTKCGWGQEDGGNCWNSGSTLNCDDRLFEDEEKCNEQLGCIWHEASIFSLNYAVRVKYAVLPDERKDLGWINREELLTLLADDADLYPNMDTDTMNIFNDICTCNNVDYASSEYYVKYSSSGDYYMGILPQDCGIDDSCNLFNNGGAWLTAPQSLVASKVKCIYVSDSDGGFNPYERGKCTDFNRETVEDYCTDDGLIEYYLEAGECKSILVTGEVVGSSVINAADICENGAIVVPDF